MRVCKYNMEDGQCMFSYTVPPTLEDCAICVEIKKVNLEKEKLKVIK